MKAKEKIKELQKKYESELMDLVVSRVCKHYKIDRKLITLKRQDAYISEPRQAAMYIMRIHRVGMRVIARYFSKDFTTVMLAANTVQDRIDTEDDFRQKIQSLMDLCKAV